MSPRNAAISDGADGSGGLVGLSKGSVGDAVVHATKGLRDDRLALLVSAVLFVLSAWPLLLVEVPPFQDLPNHLAAVTIIENPSLYPEFTFNGFLKTNAALFTWLAFVGRVVGVKMAAKLFTVLVLGLLIVLALLIFFIVFGLPFGALFFIF